MLRNVVDKTRAYYCLECGVCTASCPVARYDPLYSPRLTVERALLVGEEDVIHDKGLWSCLTCGTCNQRCPSTVDYTAFVRQARAKARLAGEAGLCTHAEKIEAIMDLQRLPAYHRSPAWLGRGARIRARSDTYYFAGCLPFLDVVFREIGFEGNAIGRSAVKLLNAVGIVPAVGEGEVCCGHDAYWTGEEDRVRDLARRNLAAIKQSGAKRVVFSCPECYHMFKQVYPTLLKESGPEPVFLLSLLAERLSAAGTFKAGVAAKVTYQDPCRLARYDTITEGPRALLRAIPELELVEMKRSGRDAVCCGSSSWISCSRVNKKIQVERLAEAVATGAQSLVTTCPKCNIHLKCALRDQDVAGQVDVVDLVTLLARAIAGKQK